MNRILTHTLLVLVLSTGAEGVFAQGRLAGTGGVSSISGAGGGGLTPWATLSSLATQDQFGSVAFVTRTDVDDFQLDVAGAAFTLRNRLELSLAKREFTIKANESRIRQSVAGLKLKVAGDLVYGDMPQIAIGAEHHHLHDPAIAQAVGATSNDGTDYYASMARAWINGPLHRTSMINLNLRYTRANQYGILGHGGDDLDRTLQLEAAAAVFLSRSVAVGAEYRQKPDNLLALSEGSASDLFLAWFPGKHFSVTAAIAYLGDIAGATDQRGFYLSFQGAF